MVVAYHYITQGDTAWQRDSHAVFGGADRVTAYGWLGVELFFVISGFVICLSAWGRPVGDFLVSRAVRLYPAYWFAIAAITVAVAIAPVLQQRLVSSEILVNLTMLQYPVGVPGASAVFWTLWVELRFYLLFALVVWRGTTYRRVVTFCALWTVASVLAESMHDPRVSLLVGEQYSPFFTGGIVIYLMYRFRPTALLWGLLGVSWALALLRSVTLTRSMKPFVGYELSWRPAAVVVTVAFGAVAAVALWPRLSALRWRWLTVAGAMTYPLYLLHLEIGWLLIRELHRFVAPWPLVVALTAAMLLLSFGVHRFVERPVSRPMRRLLQRALRDVRDPSAAERDRQRSVDARPRSEPVVGQGTGAQEPDPATDPPTLVGSARNR